MILMKNDKAENTKIMDIENSKRISDRNMGLSSKTFLVLQKKQLC